MSKARNTSITTILTTLNHEIRTPLAAMENYCQLLSHTSLSAAQQHYVDMLEKSSQYLQQLSHDLMQAQPTKTKKSSYPVSLQQCTNDCITMLAPLAAEKHIQLQIFFPADTPVPLLICSDPMKLQRILLNLLGNAIKFSTATPISLHVNYIERAKNKIKITISIIDQGQGIAKPTLEKLQKLFSSSSQTKINLKQQHGIGLKLCHNLAKQIGGKISFNTKINQGSTFELTWLTSRVDAFSFPSLATDNLPTQLLLQQTKQNSDPLLRLLLVEDSPIYASILQNFLSSMNCHIEWVTHAEAALNNTNHHLYDAIIIDLQLPDKNGYDLIKSIKQTSPYNKTTSLIAISAVITNKDIAKLKKIGCDLILEKPLTQEQLCAFIQKKLTTPNLINWQLCLKKLGHSSPQTTKLLAELMNDLLLSLKNLFKEQRKKNYAQMAIIVHQLQGSSAFYGLPPLKQVTAALAKILTRYQKNKKIISASDEQSLTQLLNETASIIQQITQEYELFVRNQLS